MSKLWGYLTVGFSVFVAGLLAWWKRSRQVQAREIEQLQDAHQQALDAAAQASVAEHLSAVKAGELKSNQEVHDATNSSNAASIVTGWIDAANKRGGDH